MTKAGGNVEDGLSLTRLWTHEVWTSGPLPEGHSLSFEAVMPVGWVWPAPAYSPVHRVLLRISRCDRIQVLRALYGP